MYDTAHLSTLNQDELPGAFAFEGDRSFAQIDDENIDEDDPEAEKLALEQSVHQNIAFWEAYFQKKEPAVDTSRLIHR